MTFQLENDHAIYEVGSNGQNLRLVDKRTGEDYCVTKPRSAFAEIRKGGRRYAASAVSYEGGYFDIQFGGANVSAVVRAVAERRYFTLEVLSVTGEDVEEMVFANVHLTLKGSPKESFACSALALNLQTNVPELPGASKRLWAACYPKFGFAGAKVALIACPQSALRAVMQEVVTAAPDLPHSPIGGPWALDAEINQGSYLFNFGNLSDQTVDEWIEVARTLGFNQIDFHGGNSFRFGDCRPNPDTYANGFASLKGVIDRLHAAGIRAGLHTYAFFIDKRCPWVTPVPDPRLAKDATFTLAEALDVESDTMQVVEPTSGMSAITGFFVRNSVTLRIDDELITYSGVSNEPPFVFTGCQRGACGTSPAPHGAGAEVHHLKECFGLFVPDPDSTLLAEVAGKTAEAFNQCGFDMMYLDALDGEDVLGGPEYGWHYGSKFVFEIWKRLERPALMEMSTFHHHLWYVRSRMGAWDHPTRSHKRFIDIHCAANRENRRMFLPGQLGWWAVKTWSGAQGEPTFPDDIEYLCCKALANDTGLSLMGMDPGNIAKVPVLARLAGIFRRYEELRHAGSVPESVKARLRAPGQEFTLTQSAGGSPQFRPVQYAKHKVQGMDGWSNAWRVKNRFGRQPVQLRIEALLSAGAYDAPDNLTLADFADPAEFTDRASRSGVQADLATSSAEVKVGAASGRFTAANTGARRKSAWAKMVKVFDVPLDMSERQALGVWVHGDGQGEVLNLQLTSPAHIVAGIGDHYIVVDFTGWRYFELIEPEGERYSDYFWPYGGAYAIYRESVDYGHVASLGLWYNNIPQGNTVTCYLSPVRALPLANVKLRNPSVTVGGETIVFPVEIESGAYLEFRSMSDCTLYDPQGKMVCDVQPQGAAPELAPGENQVAFECDVPAGATPNTRAYVTVISQGKALR
ncbi:MAG: hypothetical protein JSV65_06175 [Armatimonadota bacterium]|nr:MAG: hypothetical protein JSV65_06175 [Armatimonadota bacterium]